MDQYYQEKIAEEFLDCIRNTIKRIKSRSKKKEENNNPFQQLLLPQEAIFWSRFERSFSTSFGQRLIETISKYVALAHGAEEAATQKVIEYKLSEETIIAISQHIKLLRENKLGRKPCWLQDFDSVQIENTKPLIVVKSTFDFWYKKQGIDYFISIKTVKPNIDQTAVAKEDILKIKTAFPNSQPYFGLYYNPYGELKTSYKFNPPFKIFDMHNDSVVLIGKEYWDTIGQIGTYEEILEIAESVSIQAKKMIQDYVN